MISTRNILLLIILLVFASVESLDRYSDYSELQFWLIALGLAGLAWLGKFLDKDIFPTLLFFLILHLFRTVNILFTDLAGANFNGTYYFLPVVFFTLIIATRPQVKQTIDWWRKDQFSPKTRWLMLLAILTASAIMFVYLKLNTASIDRFLDMLPEGGLGFIVSMGLLYAALNGIVEEYIFRGMIWNGLGKIFTHHRVIIGVQAAIFGLSHYWGLPGGWSGVLLTFFFAIFLGYIRHKTQGLWGCIIVHFGINLTQYFMLFAFK